MSLQSAFDDDIPIKRGPGRPRGSPNKSQVQKPAKRGRKPGIAEVSPRAPRGTGPAVDYSGATSAERVMLAKAELIELELAERKGAMIPREKLMKALSSRNARYRARMLGIPSKWAAQFAMPSKVRQAEEALRKAIEEALSELAGDALGR